MVRDSHIVIGASAKLSSFAALMSLYESNFIRLNWLIQEPQKFIGEQQSSVPGDCTLHLRLLERTRHTSTLHMTYMFEESGQWVADPDMTIRIYHDARLAEAMACSRVHRHEILRRFDTGCKQEVSRRRLRNSMLNKWLEYCVDNDHRFVAIGSAAGLGRATS